MSETTCFTAPFGGRSAPFILGGLGCEGLGFLGGTFHSRKRSRAPARRHPPSHSPPTSSNNLPPFLLSNAPTTLHFPGLLLLLPSGANPHPRYGGHLKPITLKPVSRIFCVFASVFFHVFASWHLLRPLCFWGGGKEGPSTFSAFSRIADFENLNPTDWL